MVDNRNENHAENLLVFLETKNSAYFDLFYNSLYPLAFKVSILITKNAADADDVVQTAFYTVFNQIETCQSLKEKDNAKVKSWFLSIVYNQSKLVVRNRVRTKKKEQSQKVKTQTNESKNQMSTYLNNQMKVAINSLDEKYRTPIILKYNEGLKSSEIAGILNVNEETLRVRIRRGLAKVKDLLANDKHEFEKLLPSIALISFENYSNVPPVPKFINKDLINTKLLLKNAKFAMVKATLVIVSIAGVASFLAYPYFFKSNTTSQVNEAAIVKQRKPAVQTKMTWDLTKGNKDGIKILYGNWDFVNDGMVTTGMVDPNATTLVLPIQPTKYFKIKFTGKLEFNATEQSRPFVARAIKLENGSIMYQKEVLNKFVTSINDPRTAIKEFGVWCYKFEATLYFTKNYIGTRYHNNKIGSIQEVKADSLCEEAGALIRDFKTQTIEYIPMTEKEAQDIENEMRANLKN